MYCDACTTTTNTNNNNNNNNNNTTSTTGTAIQGMRFKCYECADFDLCEACHSARLQHKHHHADHHFIMIPDSSHFHPWRHATE